MELFAHALIPALWLAWLGYWIIAARDAKPSTRVEDRSSRLLHTIPLALAGWMIAAQRLPGDFLGTAVLPRSPVLPAYGAAPVAARLGLTIWARRWLGRNWSGVVTVKAGPELVRGGPYRYVRHPIYTGILLGFVGSAIARDEWRGVVAVAIATFALWRKLSVEERWMIETFGDAYRRFRREVPALIPNPLRTRGEPAQ
jgi:protein-S-isoprenylcysteine O-methyltransferase Ste14